MHGGRPYPPSALALQMNNREIASVVWLVIVLAYCLAKSQGMRASVLSCLKLASSRTVAATFVTMAAYSFGFTAILYLVGYWDWSLLWSTAWWTVCVGVWSVIKVSGEQDEHFFKNFIKTNLRIIVLLEFLSNAYAFPLWAELLLVPIGGFLAAASVLTERREQDRQAYAGYNMALGLLGLALLCYAAYRARSDFQNFASLDTLKSVALPLVYTIVYCPFLYVLSIYSVCEQIAVRLHMRLDDKGIAWSCALLVLARCKLSRSKLLRFMREHGRGLWICMSADEARAYIRNTPV